MANISSGVLKSFLEFNLFGTGDGKLKFYIKAVYSKTQDVLLPSKCSCHAYRNVMNRTGFWTRMIKQTWHWLPRRFGTSLSFGRTLHTRCVLFLLQPVELKFKALQRSQNSVRSLYKAHNMGIAWVRLNSVSRLPSACINFDSNC
jgi:hypothetical protein